MAQRRNKGTDLPWLAVAGAVAVCCGTTLLLTLGVGWLAAALVSPWFLVPAAATLGAWAWYRRRRRCRVPQPQHPGAGRRAGRET